MDAGQSSWSDDRLDQRRALAARGLTGAAIAEQLGGGLTRSAVIARLARMRNAGDPQVAAAKVGPVVQSQARRRHDMDRLADAWANGAVTIGDAARVAGLNYERARTLWAAIKAELGRQAA